MLLRIIGREPERVAQNVRSILNIATVICQGGYIPAKMEQDEPERLGRYWYREGDRFHLAANSNNYWANIINEGDFFMVIEFNCRYDAGNKKKNALTQLMPVFFDDTICEILT